MPMTKRFVKKHNIFFPLHIKNAILDSWIIHINSSCFWFEELKRILKINRALVSHYIIQNTSWNCRPFSNSLTNCGFSPSNRTKLLDSLVQALKAIWKQLNITSLMGKTKSLSENAVFLIFRPKKLFYTFASNKYVQDVQVPVSPEPYSETIDR